MATASSTSSSPFGAAADLTPGAFAASSADRTDWRPAPITPEWILEGRPVARFVPIARGLDDLGSTTLWDCTDGTFRWYFHWDETVHILDGAVTVTLPSGEVHRLTAGSIAFFPGGSWAVWKVEGHVRKLAVCRRLYPGPIARAVGVARRLRSALVAAKAAPAALVGALAPTLGRRGLAAAAALGALIGLDVLVDIV
ncbi:MAG: cupin domain-containing protein [Siculibacillus sp.]|nr:cupin domain-containing protein [Siculibacillus sp.]